MDEHTRAALLTLADVVRELIPHAPTDARLTALLRLGQFEEIIKGPHRARPAGTRLADDGLIADLAFLLREELGDSLSEGTPSSELKNAVITILLAAGFAA